MPAHVLPFHRPLSIGEVLDATFALFRLAIGKCLLLALCAVVIGKLPTAIDLVRGAPLTMSAPKDTVWFVIIILTGIANLLLWALLLLRQQAIATGGVTDFNAELRDTLVRAPGTLAVLLVSIPLWVLVGTGALVWGASLFPGLPQLPWPNLWRLLFLPAAWLALMLWFALPARVLSRLSATESIRRSFALVTLNWWRSAAILTVAAFAILVFYALGGVLGLLIAQLIAAADFTVANLTTQVVFTLLGGVCMIFLVALGIVQYADLGVRRGGEDLVARIEALEPSA